MKNQYLNIPLGIALLFFFVFQGHAQDGTSRSMTKGKRVHQAISPEAKAKMFQKWNMRQAPLPASTSQSPARLHYSQLDHSTTATRRLKDLRRVVKDNKTRLPLTIRTRSNLASKHKVKSLSGAQSLKASYLSKIHDLLPLKDANREFKVSDFHTDALGHTHVKMQQVYEGLEVWGSEAIIHLNPEGEELFNGRFTYTPDLGTIKAKISAEEAIAKVEKQSMKDFKHVPLGPNQLERMGYPGPQTKLLIFADPLQPRQHRLAYEVEIRPNVKDHVFYMVDAKNGEIITYMNHTCTFAPEISYDALPPSTATGTDLNGQSQTVNTFDVGNGFLLVDAGKDMYRGDNATLMNNDGLIITWDHENNIREGNLGPVSSGNNQWSRTSLSAHANASECYDYFEQVHQHVSIDNRGRDINSFINVPDEENQPMDNAYWNGYGIYYGNGDRAFSALAGALDVAAHEITHGIISSTANLVYQNEPGALNESFADVFGVLVERENFQIGEDVVNTNIFTSGALRNVADPTQGLNPNSNGYQPASVADQFRGSADNGGVHINSGIPNRAFFLFWNDEEVSTEEAEKVYYRALTEYLIRSSQFVDARLAVVQAATDLHGANSPEVAAAHAAFDAVGIADPNAGGGMEEPREDPFEELEVNPGADLILLVNDANADVDPNRIYLYDPSLQGAEAFTPLSLSEPNHPISVSDNGEFMAWVDDKFRIKELVGLGTEDQEEYFLDSTAFWSNVALSRDGNKLAAIARERDTSIYIFDLIEGTLMRFPLFNPTTAEGVTTGNVLFADAIEWTLDGEYLMYDAFNLISESGPFEEFYWDIGFMKIWDNETNTFGDGNIIKLFSDIPEGVSIGNPTFAKNAPFIITFDEAIENDPTNEDFDEYYIRTLNTETGEGGRIVENNTIGFPTYSVDDSEIAYTSKGDTGQFNIMRISLQEDRITAKGDSFLNVIEAKWPVWFATGDRNLEVDIDEELTNGTPLTLFPNPAGEQISISYELSQQVQMDMSIYNSLGQLVNRIDGKGDSLPGKHRLEVSLADLPTGMYTLVWKVEDNQEAIKFIKD